MSKLVQHKKQGVAVINLLTPRDVARLAKAADPRLSLSHTKGKKTLELRTVKSKKVEYKGPDGRYPDAFFLTGTDEEVPESWATNNRDKVEKREEPVFRSEEILCGPVQEELYDFLRNFVGHVISETAGRNGENEITTVVITRSQVLAALKELRFPFATFYDSRNHRSKKRKDKEYAGAINMVAFRKMLNYAVAKAISDRSLSGLFRNDGKRPVTFGAGSVDEIKLITEQRISDLFFRASGYAGHGHRVNLQHFLLAKRNSPVTWDVCR